MNEMTRSNTRRTSSNPIIFWSAVALGLFSAYKITTSFMEPDAGSTGVAKPPEAHAFVAPAPASPGRAKGDWRDRTASVGGSTQVSAADGSTTRTASPRPAAPTSEQAWSAMEAKTLLDDLVRSVEGYTSVTQAEAAELNRYLAGLARLGRDGIPALRELLASERDVKFKDMHGGELVNYPSLRAALIDALGEIGGPEALEALVDTLATTAEPIEIAALARALELQKPGAYRRDLLTAAQESLEVAAERVTESRGKPSAERETVDVSPLYDVMRAFGNTDLLSEMLQETGQSMPPWKVYAMIALSQMPAGEGVSVLHDALVNEEGALSRQNLFGLQMLGQAATTRPEAAEALLEVAAVHGQEIPASDWRKLAWTLRGHSYDFGGALDTQQTGSSNQAAGMKVNIHSLNLHLERKASDPATWPADRVERQVTTIDNLLALDPPAEAAYALEGARDWILRRSGVGLAENNRI